MRKGNSGNVLFNELTPISISSNSSGESGGEGDGTQRKRKRSGKYNPSAHSRRSHNETERRRRYRMKKCCEILRRIVPGLEDKTDKAKVLEYTVDYLQHLMECPSNSCNVRIINLLNTNF